MHITQLKNNNKYESESIWNKLETGQGLLQDSNVAAPHRHLRKIAPRRQAVTAGCRWMVESGHVSRCTEMEGALRTLKIHSLLFRHFSIKCQYYLES